MWPVNPPATKLIKRFYKAKHGHKASSAAIAWAWWRKYSCLIPASTRNKP